MKKAIKTMSKFLAVFLSILFIVEILPTQVMAEAYSAYSAEKQYINDLIDKPAELDDVEKADILYEVTEKRDEHTKVYKRADGTYTALVSQTPLHFMSGGVWKEIDNTLVSKNGALTNADNPFNVTLPERITSNSQITLENDGNEIAFAVNDISASNSKITDKETASTEELEVAAKNTKSEVRYEDVAEDTDIEYVILPNGIKENIIVSDAASIKDTYSFDFEIGNLSYKLNDNNSLDITDVNGDIKFTIPAPVMTDSNLALSYDIGVSVTNNNNGTITLVYAPSKEWTGASERSYPITIDPAIFVQDNSLNWVEDTCVAYSSTDPNLATQMGYDAPLGVVSNSNDLEGEIYTKINPLAFDWLSDGIVCTNAQYMLAGMVTGGSLLLKEIAQPCNLQTVDYSTKPTLSNEIIDYYTSPYEAGYQISDFSIIPFDITQLFNDWLNGGTNNGFAIVTEDSALSANLMLNGTYTLMNQQEMTNTYICIDYVYTKGYDNRFNYHSQELGRAGTAHINDFTRQLFIKRDDISLSGNIMPVTISFLYNSSIFDYFEYKHTLDDSYINPSSVYGNNWTTNYNRVIYYNDFADIDTYRTLSYITEDGNTISFIESTEYDSEDNEITVFHEENAEKLGASGYSVELMNIPDNYDGEGLEYIKIIRPDGNYERFDEFGRLTSVTKKVNTNNTTNYQTINVYYMSNLSEDNNFLSISTIEDGVGRYYFFAYDNNTGMLSSIACYDENSNSILAADNTAQMKTQYIYSEDGDLTRVIFNDYNAADYTYYADSNIKEIFVSAKENNVFVPSGYKVEYIYNAAQNTIAQIRESATGTYGNTVTITKQGTYQVKFEDLTGYGVIEQFDRAGALISSIDSKGNYSNSTKTAVNLLQNGSFESSLTSWQTTNVNSSDISNEADSNQHSLNISAEQTANKKISQSVSVSEEDVYTFSAYVKAEQIQTDSILTINIKAVDSENEIVTSNSRKIAAASTDFKRYSVQLPYTDEDFDSVIVEAGLENSAGDFFIDSLQLEAGSGAGNYDYLTNGTFNTSNNGNIASWTASSGVTAGTATVFGETKNTITLTNGSSVNTVKTLSQTVAVNGKEGDVVTFGCWAKGETACNFAGGVVHELIDELILTDNSCRKAGFIIQYTYTDENEQQQNDSIEKSISGNISDWQYISESIVLKGDCNEITVLLVYGNNPNSISFASASLTKQKADFPEAEDASEYSMQSEPVEPIQYYSEGGSQPEQTEDCCVCGENCAYGAGCPCTCASEAQCNCPECKKKFDIQFDEFGNIVSIIVNGYEINSLLSMFNSRAYTADGNYLASVTNENNKVKQYLYNQANGFLQKETDANGSEKTYSYTADGNIKSIGIQYGTLLGINGVDILKYYMTTEYDYNALGKVSKIKHNNFCYGIDYNGRGQVTRLYVTNPSGTVSNDLVSYEYNALSPRNELERISYNNGDETTYEYDLNGNIICVTNTDYNGANAVYAATHQYCYDSQGNKVYEGDTVNNTLSREVYYNNESVEIYTADGLEYYAAYDDNGSFYEIINGVVYTTSQNDGEVNETTGETEYSTLISNSNESVSIIKQNDAFGRTKQKALYSTDITNCNQNELYASIVTDYTYKTVSVGNGNYASSQVDTYANNISCPLISFYDNERFAYEYDDNGNITHEYSVDINNTRTLRYRYTYDEANQLTRVDDNVNGKTTEYYYCSSSFLSSHTGGNMTSLKEYNYTLGNNLGTATKTVNFGYDTASSSTWKWRDRLTSYGNYDITYDNAGNPTYYAGNTLTWNGKQLREFKIKLRNNLKYEYDANGLMTKKSKYNSSNTLDYSINYVWSDGKIVAESLTYPVEETINHVVHTTWHTLDARVVYAEGENSPCAVMFEDNEYLFVRNIWGDVVLVIDANTGNTLANYSYDAWGNITYEFDSSLSTQEKLFLKTLCAFTYRGYNYDFDTELYYLQSRFYNPYWGRFLNVDDTAILLSSVGQIKGANLFIYCGNNPVNMVDYSGFSSHEWVVNMIITLMAAYVTYIVLSNKTNILPHIYNNVTKKSEIASLINDALSFEFSYKPNTGLGYIKSKLLFRDITFGNVYFELEIDCRPDFEWEFILNSGFSAYAHVVANESPSFYENTFGVLSTSEVDPLAFYTDVASIGFDIMSWGINRYVHEGKYRQFVRKEIAYQKNCFDMNDATAILEKYRSYRLISQSGRLRKIDYKEAKGYENFETYYYPPDCF